MAQFREYTSTVSISDTQIVLRSVIAGSMYEQIVTRGGSEDNDFKTAALAHKTTATASAPSATSAPCTVRTPGRWNKNGASGSLSTPSTTLSVPATNSGVLVLHKDTTSGTMKYSKNGGAATTFADGDTVTFANSDTLAFSIVSLASTDGANGYVSDQDTGTRLDSISFFNSAP